MMKIILIIISLAITFNFAQDVNISGTVTDNTTGNPIHNAKVVLESAGLSGYSDIDGNFLITDASTGIISSNSRIKLPEIISGGLTVNITEKTTVELDIRSFSGKSVFQLATELNSGSHRLSLPHMQPGIYIYLLKVGNNKFQAKLAHINSGNSQRTAFSFVSGSANSNLAKGSAPMETVRGSHPWYTTGTAEVTGNTATGVEIKLTSTGKMGSQLPDPDATPADATKPVKVYILSGQSNMVGFGKITSGRGGVRWDPNKMFQNDAPDTETGGVVSVYSGAYSPTADYDALTPVSTTIVTTIGGTNADAFPSGGVRVLRGYVEAPGTGLYHFKPGYGGSTTNIMEVNGTEVHRKEVGGESVFTPIQLEAGTRYTYKVTYLSNEANGLGWTEQVDPMPGTLEALTSEAGGSEFQHLVDQDGKWTARSDAYYRGVVSAIGDGPLTPGFGAGGDNFGPELQFGHIMATYHDEPILILKTSIGNRSLSWDILPPNGVRFEYEDRTYAGYGDSINSWPTATGYDWYRDNGCTTPNSTTGNCFVPWYGGFEYDRFFDEADNVLADFDNHYPQWAGQGYEIAGFVWWQGHKDQGEPHGSRYATNMANLITVLRERWEIPNMPAVLATVAFDGGWEGNDNQKTIAAQQLTLNDWTTYPAFENSVIAVEARDHWREGDVSPTTVGYHYNHNAETYLMVGDALGIAMQRLKETSK